MNPYPRPTYNALLTRIAADLAAMPAALREPLAATWARVATGLHGHLDWLDAQCSPLTCELERLSDWAALYAVPRLLARAAAGNALASGAAGAQVLAGTLLRGANGLDYAVMAAVTLAAGNMAVSLRCTTTGLASNLVAGAQLTLINPLVGIASTLSVDASGLGGGADDEQLNDWRARIAAEWSQIVTNGARSGKVDDYRFWARSAHPSVSGAIVQPHVLGMGTVVVRPICNGLNNRLPTQAVLDAVLAHLARIAPAVADWRVAAPVLHPLTFTLHLQPAIDTAALRASIHSALTGLVLSKGGSGELSLAWAEVDATVALLTAQYVLDETISLAWAAHELPILHAINWV
ncbi:MAG: baseplate J/gp47 family protein [Gallionella sp.]